MRLRQSPPSGAAPLNWSTDPASSGETVTCIHHPGGSYKRISFGNKIGSTGNFWGVQWNSGVTEPGSSGSPLLNGNHQVIGQLNAGFGGGAGSSCGDPNAPDQFGRFDVTYPAIQQWLNGSSPPPQPTFVKGTYNGLFYDPDNGPSLHSAGAFTVVNSSKGNFTGKLQIGAARYAFRGQFDSTGAAQFNVPNRGISGQLQIDPNDSDHITGIVSGGSWTSQMDGDRLVFGIGNTSAQAGQYTIVMPNGSDPSSGPGGDSYGTVTVDRTGKVRLAAALADGSKFSQATTISKDGRWPLYASLNTGRGFIFSWINFASSDSDDLSGNVVWARPSVSTAKLYPQGFSYQATLSGSRYTRPSPGSSVLDLSDAVVVFDGGDLSGEVVDNVSIGPNSRVTNQGSDNLKLSFSPNNGLFRGTLRTPDSVRSIPFSGVVFQKQNTADGYFLGQTQSGTVVVQPSQ
jgi:hypothetical protein